MFKKISSLVLLICILVSSFVGMNTVFAYDNPSDFGQLVFQVDKSEVALGGSITFTGKNPNQKDREIYVSFQTFDENGDPTYPNESWVEIKGHTSGTDGSFSIPFTIPKDFTPRIYGFELSFSDPVLGGICYKPDVQLTVTDTLKLDKTAAILGDTVTFTAYSSEPANANKAYEIYFLDKDGNTFTSDKLWSPDMNDYYSDNVYAYGTLDGS